MKKGGPQKLILLERSLYFLPIDNRSINSVGMITNDYMSAMTEVKSQNRDWVCCTAVHCLQIYKGPASLYIGTQFLMK